MKLKNYILLFLLFASFVGFGQYEIKSTLQPDSTPARMPKINLLNQNYYLYSGEVVRQTPDSIYLKSGKSIYSFHKDDVKAVGDQNDYFREDRKTDRYFENKMLMTPSASMLKKNEVEGNLYWFLLGELKYAPTDWLNLGAGMSFLPTAESDSTNTFKLSDQFFMLSGKVRIYHRKHFTFFYKGTFVKFPNLQDSTSGQIIKIPWQSFHSFGASFTAKDFKLVLALSQPYHSDVRRWKAFNVTGTNSVNNFVLSFIPRVEYFFSVSGSYDLSRKVSFTFENILYAGAWNTLGNYSTKYRRIGWIPAPGIRMYTGNYTYGGSLMVNPRLNNFFAFPWIEGSYIF